MEFLCPQRGRRRSWIRVHPCAHRTHFDHRRAVLLPATRLIEGSTADPLPSLYHALRIKPGMTRILVVRFIKPAARAMGLPWVNWRSLRTSHAASLDWYEPPERCFDSDSGVANSAFAMNRYPRLGSVAI